MEKEVKESKQEKIVKQQIRHSWILKNRKKEDSSQGISWNAIMRYKKLENVKEQLYIWKRMKIFNIHLVGVLKETYGKWERSTISRANDEICRIDEKLVFRLEKHSKF